MSHGKTNMTQNEGERTEKPTPRAPGSVVSKGKYDHLNVEFSACHNSDKDPLSPRGIKNLISTFYGPRLSDIVQNRHGLSVFDDTSITISLASTCGEKAWSLRRVILVMIFEISLIAAVCVLVALEKATFCVLLWDPEVEAIHIIHKVFRFLLAEVLGYKISDKLHGMNQRGMCLCMNRCHIAVPSFMNPALMEMGYYFTSISTMFALLATYAVIFCAAGPVNIVLNLVALYFVGELHFFIVEKQHYDLLKDKIDGFKGSIKWIVYAGYYERLWNFIYYLGRFVTYVTYVAPFFILFCY